MTWLKAPTSFLCSASLCWGLFSHRSSGNYQSEWCLEQVSSGSHWSLSHLKRGRHLPLKSLTGSTKTTRRLWVGLLCPHKASWGHCLGLANGQGGHLAKRFTGWSRHPVKTSAISSNSRGVLKTQQCENNISPSRLMGSFITASCGQLNQPICPSIGTIEWCQPTCQSLTSQWPQLSLGAFHLEEHCNVMRWRAEHGPLAITLQNLSLSQADIFPLSCRHCKHRRGVCYYFQFQ